MVETNRIYSHRRCWALRRNVGWWRRLRAKRIELRERENFGRFLWMAQLQGKQESLACCWREKKRDKKGYSFFPNSQSLNFFCIFLEWMERPHLIWFGTVTHDSRLISFYEPILKFSRRIFWLVIVNLHKCIRLITNRYTMPRKRWSWAPLLYFTFCFEIKKYLEKYLSVWRERERDWAAAGWCG